MQWKETRKRDTNWRKPCAAVCSVCSARAIPASKRLDLREAARGIRYRLTGLRFEHIFTYYHLASQHFPRR